MTSDPSSTQQTPPTAKAKRAFPVWLSLVILLTLVLIASIGYLKSFWHEGSHTVDNAEDSQDVGTPEERQPAPEIAVISDKGQETKLQSYKGKVVLVSFWASWCGPCLEELPTFSQLVQKYQGKGLEILAINVDESIDDAKAFIPDFWKNKAIPFPTYFDRDTKAARAFNVDVLPANFVVDRKGRIAFSGMGASDWSSPEIGDSIESLLNEAN